MNHQDKIPQKRLPEKINRKTKRRRKKIKTKQIGTIAPIAYLTLCAIAIVNVLLIAFAPEAVAIFAPASYYDAIWIVPPVAMSVYFMYSYDLFAKFAFYYEKTKFIFVIIIMVSPVLSAFLFKSENGIQLDFLDTVSTTAIIIFCIIVSLVVFAISAILSIKFFEKRDLT